MTSRRQFFYLVPLGWLTVDIAAAQTQAPALDEKDPQAVVLGYVADAAKADKAKFPKYAPGQMCANCQLYQGSASDPTAPCALFGGKRVAGKGWCSSWVEKA